MNTPNLRYVLTADDRASKVFAGVRRELQSVQGASNGLKTAITGLAPSIAAVFSVTAIGAFVRNTVNGVDALNDLSDATGASVENLSALEDVAARTGTSMDTVGGAVIKLNKSLTDAKPGSDIALALEAIGLSAAELKDIDPAEALRRVAVALSGFADDGNKARLTQEFFGKSLREVAPLLNDLASQGKLNATVTTEQAKAAEAFNQQLFALQKNVTDAARSVTADLLPAINRLLEGFKGLSGIGFGGALAEVLKGNSFREAGAGVEFYNKKLRELNDERAALASSKNVASPSFRDGLNALDAEIARVTKLQGFYRQLQATAVPQADYSNEGRIGARPSVGALPTQVTPPSAKSSQALRVLNSVPVIDPATLDAIRALESTDAARIAALNAQLTALFDLQRETRGTSPGLAQAITATREALEKLDPAAQEAAARLDRVNAILAQTPDGKLDAVLKQIEDLNIQFKNGAEDTEKWAAAIRVVTGQLPQAAEETKTLGTFAEEAGRNIQDALGDTLEQSLSGNFASIGELWRNLLIKMAAQAAAAQLNSYLFGNTFGGGGTGSGAIGSFIGSVLSGARANGGPVSAGGAYLVGERGPEIVVPRSSGTVIPNGVMGGTTIVQNITVNGDVSPQTVKLVENAMGRVKADILRSQRTGGAYAGAY